MESRINHAYLIEKANLPAIILGVICSLYLFLGGYMMFENKILQVVIPSLLWIIKFILTIGVFVYSIKKFQMCNGATKREAKIYGYYVSLFSAIIITAFSALYYYYINPHLLSDEINILLDQYSTNSNVDFSQIRGIMSNIEVFVVIWSFIYCVLFGMILTVITVKSGKTIEEI